MVKALPWFSSVREKISDPKYAPWFMNFSAAVIANHSLSHVPVCDENYKPPLCSHLYHDQGQTPGYPHGLFLLLSLCLSVSLPLFVSLSLARALARSQTD